MLTDTQKTYCRDLLENLTDFELQALSQTVTQNLIAVSSRKEAIEVIIQYSESAEQVLHRQKLKKNYLQAHLIKHGDKSLHPVIVKADRESLVKLVAELWRTPQNQVSERVLVETKDEETVDKKIALSFVPWFYKMMNNICSNSNGSSNDIDWGPQHFWKDAKLHLEIQKPDEIVNEELIGSQNISEKLLTVVLNLQTSFVPNLNAKDVYGEMSQHGLLAIKCAGTLHRHSTVVGLYEQVFGLIQDPNAEWNWKIKNSRLRMKLNLTEPNSISYS